MKSLPIESLVSNYVKKHKKVGLPGLGFLEMRLSPAEVDEKKHIIHPPRQTVHFDKIEKQEENDLFIIYAVQHLKILQEEAVEQLRDFAHLVSESAREGIFEIPDIGYFIQSEGKELNFCLYENAQIISQGYGLPDLVVDGKTSLNKEDSVAEENSDPSKGLEETPGEPKKKNRYIVLLIILFIFGGVLLYTFPIVSSFFGAERGTKIQDTRTQITDIYKLPDKDSIANQDSTISVPPREELSTSDNQEGTEDTTLSLNQETQQRSENDNVVKTPTQRYYIVIAGFDALQKAQREQKQWKSKYNTKIIVKDGKFRVSVADFSTKQEAEAQLRVYRKKWKDAWKLFF